MNVEDMRDSMTPLQFAKWQAFRTMQPDPADRICEILKMGFAAVANAWGASYEPDHFEPASDKKRVPHVIGPAQAAAMVSGRVSAARGDSNGNSDR